MQVNEQPLELDRMRTRRTRSIRFALTFSQKRAMRLGFSSEPNEIDGKVTVWAHIDRAYHESRLVELGLPANTPPTDDRVEFQEGLELAIEMADGRLAYSSDNGKTWAPRGRKYRPRNSAPSPIEIQAALLYERGETIVRIADQLRLSPKQVRLAIALCGVERKKSINRTLEMRLARKREALALYRAAKQKGNT